MSINLHGTPTEPFRVRGLPVEEVFEHYNNPDGVPDLDQAIDTNLQRRPLGEILADLEDLDATVLAHHTGTRPGTATGDPTTLID
ncbi:hypothetical protein GCM10009647_066940 [Streptomyces sanglieri]|uniref:Uncharacterized protein n=1 Tax=Streptomyces sanglieri TaxID=193460 RepID=A0ABW2WQ85_9ACTN